MSRLELIRYVVPESERVQEILTAEIKIEPQSNGTFVLRVKGSGPERLFVAQDQEAMELFVYALRVLRSVVDQLCEIRIRYAEIETLVSESLDVEAEEKVRAWLRGQKDYFRALGRKACYALSRKKGKVVQVPNLPESQLAFIRSILPDGIQVQKGE